ncbi:MAG TPA: sugar transferase [Acidimicrobiia bacterium]|nr:sugar transferase [Acidimicrobiia bacterium]
MSTSPAIQSRGNATRAKLQVVGGSGPTGSRWLRRMLLVLDLASVAIAWGIVLVVPGRFNGAFAGRPGALVVAECTIVLASILAIASQRLYLARVSGVRSVEIARLARAAVLSGLAAFVVGNLIDASISAWRAAAGAALSFLLLAWFRAVYTTWLKWARAQGRYCRPVMIIGSNEQAHALFRLLDNHPEIGFRIVGVVGNAPDVAHWSESARYLGTLDDSLAAAAATGVTGVMIAGSAVPRDELDGLTRGLLRAGLHVHLHLSSGLEGVSSRRLRPLPLAYEPLFYLEPLQLSNWQLTLKRALDVTLASILLVASAPVLAMAALLIKLEDHGPVFFRQQRVGRHGDLFTMLKLRTMKPDAERYLSELLSVNERRGPLFKLERDPRRTRIGRLLEASSIDELPNLLNVLRGEMSLVGPRPALPSEVAEFDEDLLARQSVPPGITGLWQVEARDNPSFYAYKRLDIFYVENWSLSLDVAIIIATIKHVMLRIVRKRVMARAARNGTTGATNANNSTAAASAE